MPAALEQLLASARRVVAVTGAGISAGSGLPTYRGPGGLYSAGQMIPMQAHDWLDRPGEVEQQVTAMMAMARDAEPSAAHRALAAHQQHLAALGGSLTLITMNIDDLHERAGATTFHLHGRGDRRRCEDCSLSMRSLDRRERCAGCGGRTRPDVVLFGESLDLDAEWHGKRGLRDAELFLVVGSSGSTWTVARWAQYARRDYGAVTALVTIDPDPEFASAFDVVVDAPADVLADLVSGAHRRAPAVRH